MMLYLLLNLKGCFTIILDILHIQKAAPKLDDLSKIKTSV